MMSMTRGLKIRMIRNARGNGFISPLGTILREGQEYEAETNPHGAISGLCQNGEWLGVMPGEFEFVEAPEWVLNIWAKHIDASSESALKLIKERA